MSNGGRPPNGRTNLVNLGGHGGQNVKKEDALPTGGHVASLTFDKLIILKYVIRDINIKLNIKHSHTTQIDLIL